MIIIVRNILLAVNYIVDFVVVYLQEEIGMQIEIVQKQYGNASKEQSMEKKNVHNVKQFQKKYKFKSLLKNIDIMPKFDKDVFECLIDKVIIGETLEDGTINPDTIKYYKKSNKQFKGIDVSIGKATINELDNRELPYNTLQIPIKGYLMFTLKSNGHFYTENNDDGTATLYFYMSETLIDKIMGDEICNLNILLYPELCHTDEFINEITKVYYLVYDYDNFNQQDFDKVKSQAVLLWEK